MRRRVAVTIGKKHEDTDERMMPHGALRQMVNVHVRRGGGVESCPGWQALGPLEVDAVNVAEHNGRTLIAAPGALYRQEVAGSAQLRRMGHLPRLAAPRRTHVAFNNVRPVGVSSTATHIFVAYRQAIFDTVAIRNTIRYSVFERKGEGLVFVADRQVYPFYTTEYEAVSVLDGTQYLFVGTPATAGSNLARIDMLTNTLSAYGVPFADAFALRMLATSFGWVAVYERPQGNLRICRSTNPNVGILVVNGLDTDPIDIANGGSYRARWDACIANTRDGNEALVIRYLDDLDKRYSYVAIAIEPPDEPSVIASTVAESSDVAGVYPGVIGPRLDQDDGIYLVTERSIQAVRFDAIEWSYIRYSATDQVEWAPVDLREYVPVTGLSQSGAESLVVISNYNSPLYDRGHVLRIRTSPTGGLILSAESSFASGEVFQPNDGDANQPQYISASWFGQSLSIDDNGRALALVPIFRPDYPGQRSPLQVDLFRWNRADQLLDSDGAFATARAGGLTLFAGGYLAAFDGERVFDLGFSFGAPSIISHSLSTTPSGDPVIQGEFQYVVVWTWTDATGTKHSSAPSKPYSVTGISSTVGIIINIRARQVPTGMRGVQAVLYRTEGSGSTFYEVQPSSYETEGATESDYGEDYGGSSVDRDIGTAGIVSFRDVTPDSVLISRPILYTQGASGALGGQLPYDPPPACRSIAASSTRVLCGGLEDPNEVHWSHEFFPGEPPVWSDLDALRMRFPGEVVGVAWGGSQWLVFGSARVWAVSGNGPDVNGNGEWFGPLDIQGPTGAVSPLAIGSTSIGVVFQGSDKKLYVIAPGANTVSPLGPPVWFSLVNSDNVVGISEADRRGVISIVISTRTIRLVYDVAGGNWHRETIEAPGRSAVVSNSLAWIGEHSGARYLCLEAEPASVPAWAAPLDITLDLGRMYPFGQDGFGRLRKIVALLSSSTRGRLTLLDQDDSTEQVLGGVVGSSFDSGDGEAWARWEWGVPRQKRESLLLRMTADGRGKWRFHAVALDVEAIGGGRRRTGADGSLDFTPWDYPFEDLFGP